MTHGHFAYQARQSPAFLAKSGEELTQPEEELMLPGQPAEAIHNECPSCPHGTWNLPFAGWFGLPSFCWNPVSDGCLGPTIWDHACLGPWFGTIVWDYGCLTCLGTLFGTTF